MLSVQEARIQLELKQADISLREIDHGQKIADKSIQAQADDRKDERANHRKMEINRLIFAGLVLVILVCFVLAALHMGKDALVLDIVKLFIGFVGGWGASVAWRHGSRRSPRQIDADADDD